MKALHRPDLFGWSVFDESRNIDFHSVLWTRPEGNVVIDPLPRTAHDEAHLKTLGGVRYVVITNSDHVRDARRLVEATGARLAGPVAERDKFPIPCDDWLGDGDEPIAGLRVLALDGSKTPGELALVVDGHTLVTGDLVRAHRAGRLNLLPDAKLGDRPRAIASVRRLAALSSSVDAVLVGDGWPVFRDGRRALEELVASVG
jgi:glyoxylase-like metal-dependent hydrolase (beta-lactamase superfamily II)